MRVRWMNFRSLEAPERIELAPLTVIIGPNNTGKTTLYQPLVLLAQTTKSHSHDVALLTKGEAIDAGHYADLVRNHDSSLDIEFEVTQMPQPKAAKRLAAHLGDELPDGFRVTFGSGADGETILKQFQILDDRGGTLLSRTRRASGKYSLAGMARSPWNRIQKVRGDRYLPVKELRRKVAEEKPFNFAFRGVDASSAINRLRPERTNKTELEAIEWVLRYSSLNGYLFGLIGSLLPSIGYVGPLRALPSRRYELSGEPPDWVGRGGRDAPEILYRRRATVLLREVEEWLGRFDFPASISFRDMDPDGFSMNLRAPRSKVEVNIADCGVGISQVLPLIVQGLSSKEGQLLIAEQPEIHLNPRLQAAMAAFFVELVNRGRRVIIETHSEHLILRLRRLIADQTISASQVSMLFSSRHPAGTSIRSIPIQDDGGIEIEDWPHGFFEEGLTEALALSTAQAGR
jgi:hypothetical protein